MRTEDGKNCPSRGNGSRGTQMTFIQVTVAAKTEQEFDRLRDSWNAFYDTCQTHTPFSSWEWARQWWNCFGAPDKTARLLILSVSSGETLIGLFPFYYHIQRYSLTKINGLRPLGFHGHKYLGITEAASALLHPQHEQEAIQAVSFYLYRRLASSRWDFVQLQAMSQDTLFSRNTWLQGKTFLTKAYREEPMMTRELPADWDQLYVTLRKGMRAKLAHYSQQLTQKGVSWSIQIATTAEQISAAADTLTLLHRNRAASARSMRYSDHIPTTQHQQFLKTMLVTLAAQGKAAVFLVVADGEVIGAQAVLMDETTLYYYHSGFDAAWHLYSPFLILQEEITRYAFRMGKRRINFLWKDELWKIRWGAMPTVRFQQMVVFRASPVTFLRFSRQKHSK